MRSDSLDKRYGNSKYNACAGLIEPACHIIYYGAGSFHLLIAKYHENGFILLMVGIDKFAERAEYRGRLYRLMTDIRTSPMES